MTLVDKVSDLAARLALPDKIDPAVPADPPAPVFVDPTGRRQRLVRWFVLGLTGGCLSYAALLGVSMVPISTRSPATVPNLPHLDSHLQPRSSAPGSHEPAHTTSGKIPAGEASPIPPAAVDQSLPSAPTPEGTDPPPQSSDPLTPTGLHSPPRRRRSPTA